MAVLSPSHPTGCPVTPLGVSGNVYWLLDPIIDAATKRAAPHAHAARNACLQISALHSTCVSGKVCWFLDPIIDAATKEKMCPA